MGPGGDFPETFRNRSPASVLIMQPAGLHCFPSNRLLALKPYERLRESPRPVRNRHFPELPSYEQERRFCGKVKAPRKSAET